MRRCSRCNTTLPLAAFNRAGNGHQWWCRECFRAYFRERGELHLKQVKASKEARRKLTRRFVLDYMQRHPCTDCGEVDLLVLEFDHIGTKHDLVSRLVDMGVSQKHLVHEINKCEVVCRNCHRRRTAMRGCWRRLSGRVTAKDVAPRTARNLNWIYDILARSACVDCGIRDSIVLEFDHIGPKRKAVTKLAWDGYSLETLRKEVAQCEIRCCNCHARRTAERRGFYRTRALTS
jgi:hypothetical protein